MCRIESSTSRSTDDVNNVNDTTTADNYIPEAIPEAAPAAAETTETPGTATKTQIMATPAATEGSSSGGSGNRALAGVAVVAGIAGVAAVVLAAVLVVQRLRRSGAARSNRVIPLKHIAWSA